MLDQLLVLPQETLAPLDPEALRRLVSNGEVLVSFHKKNGLVRLMRCTTSMALIPEASRPRVPVPLQEGSVETFNPGPAKDPLFFTVWDLDLQAWRSFRYAALLSAQINLGPDGES
jgi:hypothetical protein